MRKPIRKGKGTHGNRKEPTGPVRIDVDRTGWRTVLHSTARDADKIGSEPKRRMLAAHNRRKRCGARYESARIAEVDGENKFVAYDEVLRRGRARDVQRSLRVPPRRPDQTTADGRPQRDQRVALQMKRTDVIANATRNAVAAPTIHIEDRRPVDNADIRRMKGSADGAPTEFQWPDDIRDRVIDLGKFYVRVDGAGRSMRRTANEEDPPVGQKRSGVPDTRRRQPRRRVHQGARRRAVAKDLVGGRSIVRRSTAGDDDRSI